MGPTGPAILLGRKSGRGSVGKATLLSSFLSLQPALGLWICVQPRWVPGVDCVGKGPAQLFFFFLIVVLECTENLKLGVLWCRGKK